MIISVLGLLLIIAGIICNRMTNINGTIILLIGLYCLLIRVILLYIRVNKKKDQVTAPTPEPPVPDPVQESESSTDHKEIQIIYSTVCKVAGVTYNCKKDSSVNRQDIISGLQDGDFLLLEEYEYKGEPAYLVIDYSSDMDIGSLPAKITEKINNEFYGSTTIVEVDSVGSFLPDDSTEEIYYCKIKIDVIRNNIH